MPRDADFKQPLCADPAARTTVYCHPTPSCALVVPKEPEQNTQAAACAEFEAGCHHHRRERLSWAKLLNRVLATT